MSKTSLDSNSIPALCDLICDRIIAIEEGQHDAEPALRDMLGELSARQPQTTNDLICVLKLSRSLTELAAAQLHDLSPNQVEAILANIYALIDASVIALEPEAEAAPRIIN